MILFFSLTTIVWTLLFLNLYYHTKKYKIDVSLREIFLLTAMGISVLIVLSTDGLSLFTLLTSQAIKLTWIIVLIILIVWNCLLYVRNKESFKCLAEEIRLSAKSFKTQPWWVYLMLSLIVITLLATLIIIYKNPTPTYGDSMRYHLVRIQVWEDQASTRHFATHYVHQISLPPFAEYAIMHINFIAGNDHLSRIVQWIALIISIVAVSELTKKFGGASRQQLVSMLLLVAMPMTIIQATFTMNDLVSSAWLLSLMVFGLRFKRDPRNLFNASMTGLALSLALFTKSTSFIFAAPFSLWIAISIIRTEGFRLYIWKAGTLIVLFILLINGRHLYDNAVTFGSPLGDNMGTVNEIFSVRVLASNVIKNIQMQMLPDVNGVPKIYRLMGRGIQKITWNLHELTGIDPQDPRNTFLPPYTGFQGPGGLSRGERAGSFIQMGLIFFTILIGFTREKHKEANLMIVVLIGTFLLFSFLLKSQNWVNRLMFPYLVMWIPLICITLFRHNRQGWVFILLMIWIVSLPWLLNTKSLSLMPNPVDKADRWPSEGTEAYFVWRPELLPAYTEITSIIMEESCSEVGIVYWSETGMYEYPFWMMLDEKGFTGTIKHVFVRNESRIYEDDRYSPCIIVSNSELDDLPSYSINTIVEPFRIYSEN